jgi:hypothetical protein
MSDKQLLSIEFQRKNSLFSGQSDELCFMSLCGLLFREMQVHPYNVKNAVELLGAFRPDVEKIQYH